MVVELIQRRLCLLFLLVVLLNGALSAAGQTPKQPARSEAWTGVVTYTRTQAQSKSETVERVSKRGKETRNWQMKYDYKAVVAVIEAPEKNGLSVGKAKISHSFSSKETTIAVERNTCDNGKTWREMSGTVTSTTSVSGTGKEEANVHVGVNPDGTYSVSVGLPQITGTMTGSQSSTFSGQCKPREGKNHTIGPTPTTIDGNLLTTDGTHRVDPKEPSRLSGSFSVSVPGGGTETISWNLQKDAAALRIVSLTFEDMKYPQWNDWQEVTEQTGTVDGNQVRIKATVFNGSGETRTGDVRFIETYKGDKWDGARPDAPLAEQTLGITLDEGEARDVELVWDSSGFAWFDDGRPRLVQRLKAEVWENSKKADELTRNLKVRPKPIVLVPGIWTKPSDLDVYQNILTTTHSYGWKAFSAVDTTAWGQIGGEGAATPTPMNGSIHASAENLSRYVNGVRGSTNAWHVDVLGHGTGGLVARLYVHQQMELLPDNAPVVKHLMLVGTPNAGVPCVDEAATPEKRRTASELTPEKMTAFNLSVTQRKGTKFSALAGSLMPVLCFRPQWNDGEVAVDSARHGIEDVTITKALHADLLNTQHFADYVRPHVVTGPKATYPFAKPVKE